MKTINITPTICKGDDATWEGSVTLRLPTFDEKFDYIERLQVTVKDDGTVEGDQNQRLKSVREMVRLSKDHYKEVNLKNKKTGEEVKSFEEMQYVEDLHPTMVEISAMLLNGFKVGNG
ncbi:hypothetical protein EB118_06760 [bacterium]|nr:hypothetical protein [bacterium]NDC94842.1 hypothetical protein [bacterium]NDD84962.1 hypothetical protein [bacterium]NDG29780.1 hypothetical protein [bacterium]